MLKQGVAGLVLGLMLLGLPLVASAQDCTPSNTGDASDNTLTCNPLTANVDSQDGNDVLNLTGAAVTNRDIQTGIGDDTVNTTGNYINTTVIVTGDGLDVVNSSSNYNGESAIITEGGDDRVTSSGAFTNSSAILGGDGDDTVTLLQGSTFDNTSLVDGDEFSFITGNNDLLIFQFNALDEATAQAAQAAISSINLAPCHGWDDTNDMVAAGCVVTLAGNSYIINNFEELRLTVLQILREQGIEISEASLSLTVQTICDDNQVKVFRTPTGDVEYYSGFWFVNAPHGFLVGRVTLAELAAGVRTFQSDDPNNPYWSVVVTSSGNAFLGQVYDNNGQPIGTPCNF